MDPNSVKIWIEIVQGLLATAASLAGGFWVWSRFVLERGLLPPAQMDLGFRTVGASGPAWIVEIAPRIQNKGSSALVVTDMRIRLRYLVANEAPQVIDKPEHPAFGRLRFPHQHVLNGVGAGKRTVAPAGAGKQDRALEFSPGEFLLIPHDTFVQPGVDQLYTFVTALPAEAAFVLVRASFHYEMRPSKTQLRLLRLSRKLGMLQYSLDHVRQPHSIEKAFQTGLPAES